MANTGLIRSRIRGVQNTAKITRAMEMIASSKMRKAQERGLAGQTLFGKNQAGYCRSGGFAHKRIEGLILCLQQRDSKKNCYCPYYSRPRFIRRSGCQFEP